VGTKGHQRKKAMTEETNKVATAQIEIQVNRVVDVVQSGKNKWNLILEFPISEDLLVGPFLKDLEREFGFTPSEITKVENAILGVFALREISVIG
jgi:hypothetical protein